MKKCNNQYCTIIYNEFEKPCVDCSHNKEIEIKEGKDIMDFLQGFGSNRNEKRRKNEKSN